MTSTATSIVLPADTNQALGIGQYACDFMAATIGDPSPEVLDRTRLFFVDAALCGLSALAVRTNAPTVLREEALEYPCDDGATVFASSVRVAPEKAVLANNAAVREWDSNGTNFGFNPDLGHTAGEFGHNDFYGVPIAAAQVRGLDGQAALRGMVLLDEIRGRLAEVFSLKSYRIDHVVHGAIASAATYGAMLGATPQQVESAIGMVVAHYIPWRAIRAGHQLSDSKGASAAISSEVAVLSMQRAMRGFRGPPDIFRNPESLFRQFEATGGDSPFDLHLANGGDDYAVMGMHFKIGLYEHQSAGALQGLINLLQQDTSLASDVDRIEAIRIAAYEPAFGIIGDDAKRDPRTRQSADHSMVYIVSTMLRKAIEAEGTRFLEGSSDDAWKQLMLTPYDFNLEAIDHPMTRRLMETISFTHGGSDFDERYPDGIPTSMVIETSDGQSFDSGLVMYPAGHARCTTCDLDDLLAAKFAMHGGIAFDDPASIIAGLERIGDMSIGDVLGIWDCALADRPTYLD